MLARVPDCTEYLAVTPDETSVEALRKSERTGRPVGSEQFVETLEESLGRRLKPGKRGRPRKETEEKVRCPGQIQEGRKACPSGTSHYTRYGACTVMWRDGHRGRRQNNMVFGLKFGQDAGGGSAQLESGRERLTAPSVLGCHGPQERKTLDLRQRRQGAARGADSGEHQHEHGLAAG